MKELLKNTAIGIGFAAVIFCVVGMVFDITNQGSFNLADYAFTKMVIACVVTGIGFGVPSMIYNKDNIPFPVQALVHMGTGCVIYTLAAFWVGWIPAGLGLWPCVISIAGELAAAFIIWGCFFLYYRKLGRKMNEQIKKINN